MDPTSTSGARAHRHWPSEPTSQRPLVFDGGVLGAVVNLLVLLPYWCPYLVRTVRMPIMEVTARLSSRNQVTVPRAVRDALALREGDGLVFRVEGDHAVMARTPDLFALAGSVSVPAAKRGTPWDEVLRQTRRARAAARR
jgi:AbrB family looped-hinge helix DNA binding protein